MFYHGVDKQEKWSRNNLEGRVCKQCCEIEESVRIVSFQIEIKGVILSVISTCAP